MANSTPVFQQAATYILITSREEDLFLLELKKHLLSEPLARVYTVNENFFCYQEFKQNPLWKQPLTRIFWLQNYNSVINSQFSDIITEFLIPFQDKTTILGLLISPPPYTWENSTRGKKWLQQYQHQQFFYSRLGLNLPQAQIILGQDVIDENWLHSLPFSFFWSLWSKPEWPYFSGGNFYWQTWEDFWILALDKIQHPLKKIRFLIRGGEISTLKWWQHQLKILAPLRGGHTSTRLATPTTNISSSSSPLASLESLWMGQLNILISSPDQDFLDQKWKICFQASHSIEKLKKHR